MEFASRVQQDGRGQRAVQSEEITTLTTITRDIAEAFQARANAPVPAVAGLEAHVRAGTSAARLPAFAFDRQQR
jgi:hypothetical protein